MIYRDFESFVQGVVVPLRLEDKDRVRLDGQRAGGNRAIAGQFRYKDQIWKVHADTHLEPLEIAYRSIVDDDEDPFEIETTAKGSCLTLKPAIAAFHKSPFKHLYIYAQ